MAAASPDNHVPLSPLNLSWADVVDDDDDVCPSPPPEIAPSPRPAASGAPSQCTGTPGSDRGANQCAGRSSPSAATMFQNLPARVRQRLKTTPRTTRAGTGKARLVASLDEQVSAKAYRRRKGPLRSGRKQGAATGTRAETPRSPATSAASDAPRTAASPAPTTPPPSASTKVGAGVRSRVVAGRRRAPATAARSPPATGVPGPLAAAGFAAFSPIPAAADATPPPKQRQQSARARRNRGSGGRRGGGRRKAGRSSRKSPTPLYTHTAWERPGSCNTRCASMYEALGREIQDYVAYRDKHAAALRPRVEADIARLQRVVTSTFDWCSLEVYGSFASGLWLPGSDVDLVALANSDDAAARAPAPVYCLYRLSEVLQPLPWIASVQVISSAKVPVMKVKTRHGLAMDVTFCEGGTVRRPTTATHNGLATLSVVRQCCDALPPLRPLALIMKQFLREQGLNEPYRGGLSSYAVVLMTTAFLQMWRHEMGLSSFQLDVQRAVGVQASAQSLRRAGIRAPRGAVPDSSSKDTAYWVPSTPPRARRAAAPSVEGTPRDERDAVEASDEDASSGGSPYGDRHSAVKEPEDDTSAHADRRGGRDSPVWHCGDDAADDAFWAAPHTSAAARSMLFDFVADLAGDDVVSDADDSDASGDDVLDGCDGEDDASPDSAGSLDRASSGGDAATAEHDTEARGGAESAERELEGTRVTVVAAAPPTVREGPASKTSDGTDGPHGTMPRPAVGDDSTPRGTGKRTAKGSGTGTGVRQRVAKHTPRSHPGLSLEINSALSPGSDVSPSGRGLPPQMSPKSDGHRQHDAFASTALSMRLSEEVQEGMASATADACRAAPLVVGACRASAARASAQLHTAADGEASASVDPPATGDTGDAACAAAAGMPPAALGVLMVQLLQYFGAHFRSDVFGLSVRDGGFYFALPPPQPSPYAPMPMPGISAPSHVAVGPSAPLGVSAMSGVACALGVQGTPAPRKLVMEDPLAPGQNVAASSFNFGRVASVLEDSYFALSVFRPTQFKPTLLSCMLHRSGWTDFEHQLPGFSP